jgi:hypothetical protein
MVPLGILDLLQLRGYDVTRPAKLVRHTVRRNDTGYDVDDLLRRGWFETWQAYQGGPFFDRCDYIVSFSGGEGTKARFIGVYRVLGRRDGREGELAPGCPPEWTETPQRYFYQLKREAGYEDLERRVVVEWGRGSRAWHQGVSNKEVVEILPKGQLLPPLRDYLEFTLTHAELGDLYRHEDAHREWRARLKAVAGVYLIVATTTGSQYVGSAYGVEGIWGRWAAYASDGHGGNVLLKKLIEIEDPIYPAAFSYSILQILPMSSTRSVVLELERRYKEKLGRRAISLNAN